MSDESTPAPVTPPSIRPRRGRHWYKGMPSPNPGGKLQGIPALISAAINQATRYKGKDEAEEKKAALFTLFKVLAEISVNPAAKPGDRQAAAVELLDRWLGKSVERTVNLNVETKNDTARILADPRGVELLADLERLAAGKADTGGTGTVRERGEMETLPAPGSLESQAP